MEKELQKYWGKIKEFNYGFDKNLITHERGFSARLMFIPKKDAIYNVNINKWTSKRGA